MAKQPGICPDCNEFKLLERHRVVPGVEGGSYEDSNIIQVCPECHRNRHTELFKEMGAKAIRLEREELIEEYGPELGEETFKQRQSERAKRWHEIMLEKLGPEGYSQMQREIANKRWEKKSNIKTSQYPPRYAILLDHSERLIYFPFGGTYVGTTNNSRNMLITVLRNRNSLRGPHWMEYDTNDTINILRSGIRDTVFDFVLRVNGDEIPQNDINLKMRMLSGTITIRPDFLFNLENIIFQADNSYHIIPIRELERTPEEQIDLESFIVSASELLNDSLSHFHTYAAEAIDLIEDRGEEEEEEEEQQPLTDPASQRLEEDMFKPLKE